MDRQRTIKSFFTQRPLKRPLDLDLNHDAVAEADVRDVNENLIPAAPENMDVPVSIGEYFDAYLMCSRALIFLFWIFLSYLLLILEFDDLNFKN